MTDTVFRGVGAADPTDWLGLTVYESAADTVALSTDATSEIPLGTVHRVDPTLAGVEVCVGGLTRFRVGTAGLTAGDGFVVADAAAKAKKGSAGEYSVGRFLGRADADEDDLVPGIVNVCQLAQAGT